MQILPVFLVVFKRPGPAEVKPKLGANQGQILDVFFPPTTDDLKLQYVLPQRGNIALLSSYNLI